MGIWKDNAKSDNVNSQGQSARASGKEPFPGVLGGDGVLNQMNPRRQRRENYDPKIQPREKGVRY